MSGNKGIDNSLLSTAKDIKSGSHRVLFSAPEAVIDSEFWCELLRDHPLCDQIVAVVIDEAHCVYSGAMTSDPLIQGFTSLER